MHGLKAASIVGLCLIARTTAAADIPPVAFQSILTSAEINAIIAAVNASTASNASYVTIKSGGAKCDGVTDDTAAINSVLAANRVVTIPAGTGTCMVAGTLNVVLDHSVLSGPGLDSATIKATNANLPVVRVGAGLTQVTLSGFSVDRVPSASNQYLGFALGGIAYGQLVGTIAVSNFSDGVYVTNSAGHSTGQWTMLNTISQGNDGWGYNVVSTALGGQLVVLPWLNVTSFGNTMGGAAFHGQPGAPIYDVTIMGGVFSTDGNDELYFDTYGGQVKIAGGTFAELAGTGTTGRGLTTPPTHVGNGIHSSGAVGDMHVIGAYLSANSQNGALIGAFRSAFIGNVATQNGQALPNNYRGLDFENNIPGSTVMAVGNRLGNQNTNSPQGVGISLLNGIGTTVIGNDLTFNGTAGLAIGTNATSSIVNGNAGFVVEGSGVGNIPALGTSVVMTHSMAITPTQVWITPNTFQGAGQIWVDTITPTSFTVHISAASSTLVGFSWLAKVFNG